MELCNTCSAYNDLETISNIRFSPKEIDVLSCLVNGRSAKSMEQLLGVPTKTVEFRIRSVKTKIEASATKKITSKEQVMDFVEKSDKVLLVNKHYSRILINAEFEKLLKKIGDIGIGVSFVCLKNSENCERIMKHFALCNITINHNSEHVFECNSDNYYQNFLGLLQKLKQNPKVDELIEEFNKFRDSKTSNVVVINKTVTKYFFHLNKFLLAGFAALTIVASAILYASHEPLPEVRMDLPTVNESLLLRRPQIIEQIDKILESQNGIKIAVLTGVGGAGKTTLAREYLKAQRGSVVWELNSETENSLINSYSALANELANTKEKKEDLSLINAVSDQREKNKRLLLFIGKELRKMKAWYLLFDNVDNFKVVKEYLPRDGQVWGNGTIIITTRNEILKNVSYINPLSAIPVTALDTKTAAELCSRILGKEDKKKIIEFVKKLPPHPLDISSAAHYMKNYNIGYEEYLQRTEKVSTKFETEKRELYSELYDYDKTRYGILSSTFDSIIKVNTEFKELLLFVCLLDSQNIPISYLKQLKDPIIVDEFIYCLRKHSMITKGTLETFSIHRSTQEIGLKCMNSILSEEEKVKYLDKIVKFMTPYECMLWSYYSKQERRLENYEIKHLLMHLEHLLANIEVFGKLKKFEEYKTKILLAALYAYLEDKPAAFTKPIIEKILRLNQGKNYFGYRELAVLSLESIDVDVMLQNFFDKEIENRLQNVLKICLYIPMSDNLKVSALYGFARIYCERGEFQKCLQYFREAKDLLSQIKEQNCYRSTKANLCNRYYYCLSNHYIMKKELFNAVKFIQETLEDFGATHFFYKKKRVKREELPYYVHGLRRNLAGAYNRLEKYDQALECEKETYFFYNKDLERGTYLITYECLLEIEHGHTLLRLNRITEAYKVLSHAIKMKKDIRDFYRILPAIIYRSEASIHLNKFDEAYNDCKEGLKFTQKSKTNFAKLMGVTCYYNMAIAKHKLSDARKSTELFQKFFELSKSFCKGFLDKSVYEKLTKENAFEIIKNTGDIQKCLDNALKIFTTIYGPNHSFVKDYVAENCKQHSWIYKRLKIGGYYLDYFWDCCKEFLGMEVI